MAAENWITCPFCFEGDFDEQGLKSHLKSGDCEAYNNVPDVRRIGGDNE